MTYIMKRVSIAIMVAVFIATMCLSMIILPSKAHADSVPYAIGDIGPAGGIIFYVDGSSCLEAAPSDQGTYTVWSNITNSLVGTGTDIGTGEANTAAILLQDSTAPAAKLCRDYNGGGFTDWFLPSRDELNLMYVNLKLAGLGGFDAHNYWSSSEHSGAPAINAWEQYFDSGGQADYAKEYGNYVRAIRAFTVPAATGSAAATYVEPVWVRTMPMTCYRVWVNEDNKFQFVFWYPYRDNNWVKIYDMSGKMVYEIDMPYDNPNLIVDLPNGMYTVKTFTVGSTEPIQTFLIGK